MAGPVTKMQGYSRYISICTTRYQVFDHWTGQHHGHYAIVDMVFPNGRGFPVAHAYCE